MKKTIMFLGMLVVGLANAQQEGKVGINTDTPKATLQVKSTDADQAKGILTPQLTGDKLREMTANLTADQNGMITFATNGVTALDNLPTNNVQFAGYHRFNVDGNNKSWVRLEPSGLEKIKGEGTNTGWALVGRDATKYGRIGLKSVDISAVNSNAKAGVVMGATGNHSLATGLNTSASGWNSTTMGNGTIASGNTSTAIGSATIASGNFSLSAGNESQATGWSSTAIGNKAIASGSAAVALGNQSLAKQNYSFATGNHSKANGLASISIGFSTVAEREQETAIGMYNTIQTDISSLPNWHSARVLVVGNGSGNYDNVETVRSDAFTILRNGKIGIDIDNFEAIAPSSNAKLQVNGAIKVDSKAETLTCNEHNAGTMSYKEVNGSGVFGFCTKKESGEYVWAYLKGAQLFGESTNGGAFGAGL